MNQAILSVGELFQIYFQTKWKFWREEIQIRRDFYKHKGFRICDKALKKSYRFCNPYIVSRRFLESIGEESVHMYGETPITTLNQIARLCHLTSRDHFVDLGCGRGRGLFFLSEIIGCRATGIEQIPKFVEKALRISEKYASGKVEVKLADFLASDLSFASVIYLYGTCLSDEQIALFTKKVANLKPGTKILTVSYPLEAPSISQLEEAIIKLPWGEATLFIQQLEEVYT